MMNKGQTAIGLVILGVVTITAVIGLVLLFTRASAGGAAVVHAGQFGVITPIRTPVFAVPGDDVNYWQAACETELLNQGAIESVHRFDCYALPTSRSALSDRQQLVGCYLKDGNSRSDVSAALRSNVQHFVEEGHSSLAWSSTRVNGQEVPMCLGQ